MQPSPQHEELIAKCNLGVLATLRRDGIPQLTPVNYAYKDGRFLISTTRDRAKYPNVRRNENVSLCIVDAAGRPYVTVYGKARVEEEGIEAGTAEIFRRMSDRPVPDNFGELLREQRRVLIVMTPERFVP